VKSLADIKNVKLRVLPTPAFIETFKIMGAIPTPIPFGELYMAAQTGVVDGFEHDAGTVLASKLNEVTKSLLA
jgi:TRAP-type C4-dicarboxylate transport system substrate-binding protein